MGRKRRKAVVKYRKKPETVTIFEKALKEFPECSGTYPDCPEMVDISRDPCMHCPVFLESGKKNSYLKKIEKTER